MKEWEYMVYQMTVPDIGFRIRKLNEFGEKGWELVQVEVYRNLPVFYLKKPKKKE